MGSKQTRMAEPCCRFCGADAEAGLIKRREGWICDDCDAVGDLDLDEHEEQRNRRLAEAEEY